MQVVAQCIAKYEVHRLQMILGPIAKGLGAEYTPGAVKTAADGHRAGKGKTTPKPLDRNNPKEMAAAKAKEQKMILAAAQAGIRIYED